MSTSRNMAEEYSETLLYGISYQFSNWAIQAALDKYMPQEPMPTANAEQIAIMESNGTYSAFLAEQAKARFSTIQRDAIEGALTVLVSGLVMKLVRAQGIALDFLFAREKILRSRVLGFASDLKNRIKGLRGVRAINRFKGFQQNKSDSVAMAAVNAQDTANHIAAQSLQYQSTSILSDGMSPLNYSMQKETLQSQMGIAQTKVQLQAALVKLLSGSFSANDKTTLKRVFSAAGTPLTDVEIEKLNAISSFLFVKDTQGNVTGLSEQFFRLTSYMNLHNKTGV